LAERGYHNSLLVTTEIYKEVSRNIRSAVLGFPPRLSRSKVFIVRVGALPAALGQVFESLGLGERKAVGDAVHALRELWLAMSAGMLVWRRWGVGETLVLAELCKGIERLELVLRQAIWELVEALLSNDCVSFFGSPVVMRAR
jgi:hypothetical protein